MTTLGNLTKQYSVMSGLVSTNLYVIIIEYAAVIGAVLSFIGVFANIIIIRTFIGMGINDGVTVSFLALAVFDLAYLTAGVSLGITVMFYVTELKSSKRFPIEPYGLSIYFTNIMILLNVTNVLTTTFLAVARSMCVARPLQFKNSFTRDRAVFFMIGFATFSIIIYTPIFANMGMSERFDRWTNTSRPSWWGSGNRETVKEIVWVFTEVVLPVSTEFITIICVVIMANCLRAASRFRHSSVLSTGKAVDKQSKNKSMKNTENTTVCAVEGVGDKLSGKDVRVVQQVVLISVVYIVCNIPKLLISLTSIFEPEFAIGRRYMKLYMSANGLRKHFEMLNSTVNLIIYYKYNTKFRSVLLNQVE